MKVLLFSGKDHVFISRYLSERHKTVIVNKNELYLSEATVYLKENPVPLDKIVITDGGLSSSPDDNMRELAYVSEVTDASVIVITRDFLFDTTLPGVKVVFTRWFRAVENDFDAIFNESTGNKMFIKREFGIGKSKPEPKCDASLSAIPVKTRKWGSKKRRDDESDNFDGISVASSKVVVFTGHRGAGSTSTSVNIAIAASRRGANSILVDLDVDYRSSNLYFGEFYQQADRDEYIASSLMRTLAQPQSYQMTAVNIENNLWVTALGYDFNDKRLIEQHFTESKILGLITTLKYNFDFVAVDLPLDELARFPSLLNSIDVLALCMENTVYSAITTLRNISNVFKERERVAYLASKSKLVVTKYNDESTYNDEIITPDRLSELIVSEGFNEDFTVEMPVAGSVPYINWFGKQIESDMPVMDMDSQMQKSYDEILLRLLGVAR